jgi:TonB family protein
VRDAKVVKSIPMLDAAAVAAVRQWRFPPYLDQGMAVWAWTRVPVRFSLH